MLAVKVGESEDRCNVSAHRIICADTNPYFSDFVTRLLEHSGYDVAATTSAAQTLSLITDRPDYYDLLIVADWLPDMKSEELFQALRAIPFIGRIAVTIAELTPGKQTHYESLGASSFLLTPVGYSDILRVVNPPTAQTPSKSPE